jgi:hypothetical protein
LIEGGINPGASWALCDCKLPFLGGYAAVVSAPPFTVSCRASDDYSSTLEYQVAFGWVERLHGELADSMAEWTTMTSGCLIESGGIVLYFAASAR